jgi:hypothetical protein
VRPPCRVDHDISLLRKLSEFDSRTGLIAATGPWVAGETGKRAGVAILEGTRMVSKELAKLWPVTGLWVRIPCLPLIVHNASEAYQVKQLALNHQSSGFESLRGYYE